RRTELTDLLHKQFQFRTDYQFITKSQMKNVQKKSKYRE
ncbi:MAG: transposase, partial [Eubacteriales bacterium]